MGNYTDWVTGTCIKRWAEEKNLAVVMPSGANMFYMDHPNANENYSEFIGKELVKINTKNVSVIIQKRRYIYRRVIYGRIRCNPKWSEIP